METPRSLMHELLTFRSGDAKRMWRDLIKQRDGYRCSYCGSPDNLTIDHVVPQCKGGPTSAENCRTACLSCNQAKGSLSLDEFLTQNFSQTIAA